MVSVWPILKLYKEKYKLLPFKICKGFSYSNPHINAISSPPPDANISLLTGFNPKQYAKSEWASNFL